MFLCGHKLCVTRHLRLQVSNVSLNILFHFYSSAIGFRMKRTGRGLGSLSQEMISLIFQLTADAAKVRASLEAKVLPGLPGRAG